MPRTFEELASQELDALYQGALFLHGGDPGKAEDLLVETLTGAAAEYDRAAGDVTVRGWLEGRLARSYLTRADTVSGAGGDAPADPGPPDDTARLLAAARRLPPLPRAALWLVLLRRWSYADTSEALGVGDGRLAELLAYRDVLFSGVMGGGARGTGTDGMEGRD